MKTVAAVDALAALAHTDRLALFRLLVRKGPDGLPAGRIAETLGVVPSTLTFHLDCLREAGLVTARREGRSVIYAARFDAMIGLVNYLTENCCAGLAESTAPERKKVCR